MIVFRILEYRSYDVILFWVCYDVSGFLLQSPGLVFCLSLLGVYGVSWGLVRKVFEESANFEVITNFRNLFSWGMLRSFVWFRKIVVSERRLLEPWSIFFTLFEDRLFLIKKLKNLLYTINQYQLKQSVSLNRCSCFVSEMETVTVADGCCHGNL